MSIPTTSPVISRIREACKYALSNRIISGGQAIRYSNTGNTTFDDSGYYNDIKYCYDVPVSYESATGFPFVNMFIDHETCSTGSDVRFDQNSGMLHNKFSLRLEVFLNTNQNQSYLMDTILADIQKYFGINYYIPDSTGNATCMNCYYSGSDRWSLDINSPICGITIVFDVWYRQRLIDPTILS
jgi:hypothetical protein